MRPCEVNQRFAKRMHGTCIRLVTNGILRLISREGNCPTGARVSSPHRIRLTSTFPMIWMSCASCRPEWTRPGKR